MMVGPLQATNAKQKPIAKDGKSSGMLHGDSCVVAESSFSCASQLFTWLATGSDMGALRDQTALNIREWGGRRKQKPQNSGA